MQPEIEAKFPDITIETMRSKLVAAGATPEKPMRLMRRVLIEEPHHKAERSFLRIRDEGDRTTLTYKRKQAKSEQDTVDSTHELETTVGDFDTTVKIFTEAGWRYITYQETRRETWRLGDVEIVIDQWPWIAPVLEIEGVTKQAVRDTATALGLSWGDAFFGSIDTIYRRDFPNISVRGIIDIKDARLNDPVPPEFQ